MRFSGNSTPVINEECPPVGKREKKRMSKEMAPCRTVLDELEAHDEAWPFLLAVNTKQFPTYRKIIRNPMDLQTINKRIQHNEYVVFVK